MASKGQISVVRGVCRGKCFPIFQEELGKFTIGLNGAKTTLTPV